MYPYGRILPYWYWYGVLYGTVRVGWIIVHSSATVSQSDFNSWSMRLHVFEFWGDWRLTDSAGGSFDSSYRSVFYALEEVEEVLARHRAAWAGLGHLAAFLTLTLVRPR